MSEVNDGGPAFPVYTEVRFSGMSLRDWFAGQALPAVIDAYCKPEANGPCIGTDHFLANVPVHAYRMADAMMKAREKR